MSSDIDLAVRQCKELESILRSKRGADGKGLHQLVTSVESRLPPELVRTLRRIATIRNKIVHEADYPRLDDKKQFVADCARAKKQLRQRTSGRRRSVATKVLGVGAVILIIIIVILAYVLDWTGRIR